MTTAVSERGTRGRARASSARDAGGPGGLARNVNDLERVASVALGAALVGTGIRRRDAAGVATAVLGGFLLQRGATGRCAVYSALGVSTGEAEAVLDAPPRRGVTSRAATVNARKAIKVERNVTVNAPRAVLYAYWKDFSKLPTFMDHLVAVRVESASRSHWVAKAPGGGTVEWDAEVVNDVPNSIIAWKSVGNADVANAGAVNFKDAPGGRGTVVRVTMDYEPPAGRLGQLVATLFGENPDRQVREDLRRFKQLMETGAITTSARRHADDAAADAIQTTPRS